MALTPAFFFLEHWGPEGIPPAEGCSGAGGADLSTVRIRRQSTGTPLDVATDGFFVLETQGITDPSSLIASTQVAVTTVDGTAVPGKLSVLQGKDQGYLTWQADAPLPVGAKLNVRVEGGTLPNRPVRADEAQFQVIGEPALLSAGTLSFDTWVDFRHGVGERFACKSRLVTCGPSVPPLVYPAEQKLSAVTATWSAGVAHGFTAWEVDVVPEELPADKAALPARLIVAPNQPQPVGYLVFAEQAVSHCVAVVVKDLRTSAVQRARQCATPTAPRLDYGVVRDFPLSECDAPPSVALTSAWCEATGAPMSTCPPPSPPTEPSEPTPSEPTPPTEPSEPTPSEPTPSEPTPPTSTPNEPLGTSHGAATSGTSRSCQVALVGASAAGGAVSGFGVVVGLLSLWSRRRGRAKD